MNYIVGVSLRSTFLLPTVRIVEFLLKFVANKLRNIYMAL
jgi:hypothetical protein